MRILGIETSCDETSAAVVLDGRVLSNVVSSQVFHSRYGGVVPELASRAHQRLITQVVGEALAMASTRKDELEGVASTYGPGLVGALLVGLNFGKALSYGLGIPFTAVDHMQGHLYSLFLAEQHPEYPYVCLVVSGGHTMLVKVDAPLVHSLLGQTRDDAAGEAFDKVAKMLGLGYPGGPAVDRIAAKGNSEAIDFPRSWLEGGSLDFSFSGVKTAVLYYLRHIGADGSGERTLPEDLLADICASFQRAVVDVLVEKTIEAARRCRVRSVGVAGGVAANSALRAALGKKAAESGFRVSTPPLQYCMDNGAMIAYVGGMRLERGLTSAYDTPAVAYLELSGMAP
ncbi:MAG TPA: tRNA (adenosine(37)-N6)-threonylcarbamoyltransferase complex transferase subunit TsaD [Bacteroidota bacterium]|nr:tRNA (adenosine(37)-N6)-threonylcarbamoyltransferase complex transferase subunit TsaD [Bacteroidota bacterium]